MKTKKRIDTESGGYRFPPDSSQNHNFPYERIRRRIKSFSRIIRPLDEPDPSFESGGSTFFCRIYPPPYQNLSNSKRKKSVGEKHL